MTTTTYTNKLTDPQMARPNSPLTFAQVIAWSEQRNAAVMSTRSFEDGLGAYWDLVRLEIDTTAYQHLLFEMSATHDGGHYISLSRQFFEDGEPITFGFSWKMSHRDGRHAFEDVCLYGGRLGETCDVAGSREWATFRVEVERHVRECTRSGWMLTGEFLI